MFRSARILSVVLGVIPMMQADVHLPAIFGSNMVLQRNQPVPVWGFAAAQETVRVEFNGQSVTAVAGRSGKWKLSLGPMEEGGPFSMKVRGTNTVIFDNVLIGEVWICSGQSNMAFQLGKTSRADEDVANASNRMIRLFTVKRAVSDTVLTDVRGKWSECSPEVAGDFSGVAYFFGKHLHEELKIPIGLVHVSWGGTAAEGWIPREVLERDSDFVPILERWNKDVDNYPLALREFEHALPSLTEQWNRDSVDAVALGKALPRKPTAPRGPGHRDTPSGQYNGMLHPLIPFAMRGVIWYQGEANAQGAYQYRKLFLALISAWRNLWRQGDYPFHYVQLPSLDRQPEPSKSGWAELREAQLLTLKIPNTGMAVTIDVGDPKDLHPTNKRPVGERLAKIAFAKTYGKEIEFSGPMLQRVTIDGNKVRLAFRCAESGLVTKGNQKLLGFSIAGSGKDFLPADAVIDGSEVIVTNKEIANPLSVRYAWADNPECNLYNKAELPASPFRTDDWPEVTYDKK